MTPRNTAVLRALLVTFLWSTSFIITKWLFAEGGVGPLWLNALQYGAAAGVLLAYRQLLQAPPAGGAASSVRPLLWKLVGLGLLTYTVTQGGIALGLHLLPSSHVALILNLNNTLQVVLFSALLLREMPAALQWAGLGVSVTGAAAFYYPFTSPPGGWWGALPVLITGVGYALSTIYTRRYMRDGKVGALDLTVTSMGAGALGMAAVALTFEGIPSLTVRALLYLGWLAVVNTAFSFTLWTHTQKVLSPFETSALNNTMLVQIALLSWLLLGEPLGGLRLPGVVLVTVGTMLVQAGPRLGKMRRAA